MMMSPEVAVDSGEEAFTLSFFCRFDWSLQWSWGIDNVRCLSSRAWTACEAVSPVLMEVSIWLIKNWNWDHFCQAWRSRLMLCERRIMWTKTYSSVLMRMPCSMVSLVWLLVFARAPFSLYHLQWRLATNSLNNCTLIPALPERADVRKFTQIAWAPTIPKKIRMDNKAEQSLPSTWWCRKAGVSRHCSLVRCKCCCWG